MTPQNFKSLLSAARREPAPEPPAGFAARVMDAVRRENPSGPLSLLDQFDRLVPRLALAAAALIVLCLTADFCLQTASSGDLSGDTVLASEQWLFAAQ